jgi:serine/threonine protein phosphatase 1
MSRRYAISDIHGNYRTFLQALDTIQLSTSDTLYLLGDYVDRGPSSRRVFQRIFELIDSGYDVRAIRGNHERYMLQALESDNDLYHLRWLKAGGGPTLDSYRLNEGELYPDFDDHLEWVRKLPYYLDEGGYLFVHAGLDFSLRNPLSDPESMTQIRRWKEDLNRAWLGDRTVVHGHTPIPKDAILAQTSKKHKYPVFNIDGGCFHYEKGFGHLCVMDLDRRDFTFIPNADMDLAAIRAIKRIDA